MARAKANKIYRNFVKGMITETNALQYPENATLDELNCEISIKGNRKRRPAFNLEDGYSYSSQSVALTRWSESAINTSTWNTVGGNGNTNFLVVQIGNTLYFYDLAFSILSDGQKAFTVNLESFAAPGATEIHKEVVQVASGKGFLFVVGSKIESFYIEYDPATDDITSTQISIEIRDFDGVDDGLDPDEEPTTLSNQHSYNLKNQGWVSPGPSVTDPVTSYFSSFSKYPPNSKQWWQGKDSSENFSPSFLSRYSAGNTLAPRGRYILSAFHKDRSSASGVSGIDVVSITERPKAVSFFAGRVFYAGVGNSSVNGHIFFSQIAEDETKFGKCYQVNDPTSEDLNSLLDTDGGVIIIPEAGNVVALMPVLSSLIVFADNGIWSISGGESGFKATDFKVTKISSVGALGALTIVDVEGIPVWFGVTGILSLGTNDVTGNFVVQNLTQQTIQTFYNEIPFLCKKDAKGFYDRSSRKVRWLYRETSPESALNRFRYNRLLNFDTQLGAFYPWEVSTLSQSGATFPHYVASGFATPALNFVLETSNVLSGSDTVIATADTVVADVPSIEAGDGFTKYLCFRENATVGHWTFGGFNSTTFYDWYSVNNTGVDYSSYFETGNELLDDIQRLKQAKYVHVYFNRTETAYTDVDYDAWVRPSSCFMQAKWEWADHMNSHKFSPAVQVYRFRREYTPSSGTDYDSGFPVTVTKNRIRGVGRALRIKFYSEAGKDFDILGWAISYTGTTED